MKNGSIYTLKDYFQEKYKVRVYKIIVDAGFTCPNRDGTKGEGGCLYCDPQGSGNNTFSKGVLLEEQVRHGRAFLKKRYRAEKFYIYFQAFSNTYAPVDELKALYDRAVGCDEGDIVGIMIGTRPDCIDREKLEMIASFAPKYDVWIEYGLQTIHQKTLEFINRKHTADDYVSAVDLTADLPLKITTHIIAGLPHESKQEIMETVRFLVKKNRIHALKIHSLFVPRGSALETLYQEKKLNIMSMEEYVHLVTDIIEVLPPHLIVARMAGETYKGNLVAPDWADDKQKVIREIYKELKRRGSFQGKKNK
ncbi:MAG: TIGR01212 family radical SAM protein [Spirochaetes bacterium]|nr:TIGR01212 family radical SAM protein [Spirochaetota bacterium]